MPVASASGEADESTTGVGFARCIRQEESRNRSDRLRPGIAPPHDEMNLKRQPQVSAAQHESE